jgi:hypothetical protein
MAPGFLRRSTAAPRWLTAAQAAWVVYAVASLSIDLWVIPYRWSQTSIPGWPGWSQADSLRALAELHIAPGAIAHVNHWFDFTTPLIYLGVGAIVFWKRSIEPAGLLWAAVLALFCAPFATLGEAYPYLKPLGDVNNALSSTLIFAALFTFPNGRFTPRWTHWVTHEDSI